MIPQRSDDLDALLAEVERQYHEVGDLFEEVSTEAATWRPDPTRWSMAGHLAHLGIVNAAYLDAIEEALRSARARGGSGSSGPFRHPRIATWFVRQMEPPPKRRVRTFRSMTPEDGVDPADAVKTFQGLQGRLERSIEESRGLDLGRVRFGSPFFAPLRFSLGTAFEVVLAHNRRHVWLMRELIDGDGFPR